MVNQAGLRGLCSGVSSAFWASVFPPVQWEEGGTPLAQHALVRITPALVDTSSKLRE